MMLRRVIKHVRNLEWTAIVIDFFIVVAGLYNDWNDTVLENFAHATNLLQEVLGIVPELKVETAK